MLRTIRKGLYKSNNVRFLALLIAVAFVLLTEMACVGNMTAKAETAGDVAASVYADTEAPGVATPTSVVEKLHRWHVQTQLCGGRELLQWFR